MPIFRCKGRLAYFAHVPKAAGTAVEIYLENRFGDLAFLDRNFLGELRYKSWNRTSPQHCPGKAIDQLFGDSFFDLKFAVVRNPVARFASGFTFHKTVLNSIPCWMGVSGMLAWMETGFRFTHDAFDGHFLPQVEFLPDGAHTFRLEDGLTRVTTFLDEFAEERAPHIQIGHENASNRNLRMSPSQIRRIERIYAADYEALGYERQFPDA